MDAAEDFAKALEERMQDSAFVAETRVLLGQFAQDDRYFDSIYDRMLGEHPNEFVAVYRGKVVAAHETYAGIVAEIERQGIPVDRAVIRDIETNPTPLIL